MTDRAEGGRMTPPKRLSPERLAEIQNQQLVASLAGIADDELPAHSQNQHATINELLGHLAALDEDRRFVEFRVLSLKDQLTVAGLADRPEFRGAIRQVLGRLKA